MKPLHVIFLFMLLSCWGYSAHAESEDAIVASEQSHKILILHSYHEGMTWTDGEDQGIRDLLETQEDIELYTEYMDSKRIIPSSISEWFGAYLSQKYQDEEFDAIIATDDNALMFLARNHSTLFPGTPVIFCGINDFQPDALKKIESPVTGVLQKLDIEATLELIQQIQPDVQTLAVISGSNPTAQGIREEVEATLSGYKPTFQVLWLNNLDTNTLLSQLKQLSPKDAVLLCNFNRDANGKYYTHEESANLITTVSPAPVYAMQDLYSGTGVVGGVMLSSRDQGKEAARLCMVLLNEGKTNETIQDCPQTTLIDYIPFDKYQLDISRLPKSAVIINQPVSFYEKNKELIWGVSLLIGFLVLALAGVTFGLIRSRDAQKILSRNEKNLRTTLDSIGDAVIATDVDGLIVRMNPVAEWLTGWNLEEAQGKPLTDIFNIINAQTRLQIDTPVQTVLKTGNIVGLANHTALVAKDGTEYQIADSAAPIRTDQGELTGVVMVFRDVTEEYQMRRSIVESQEQLNLAIQGAELGTWDWDVSTGKVSFNSRWAEILGYTLSEIEPHYRFWEANIHPDDFDLVMKKLAEHLKGYTSSYEAEHRLRHKSGKWVWILAKGRVTERDDKGNPIRVSGTHLDVTTRRQAEDDLRQSEERYRLAQHLSDVGTWEWNIYTNEVFWSDEVLDMLGIKPDDFHGKYNDIIDHIHPDDVELWKQNVQACLDKNQEHNLEYRVVWPDGSVHWVASYGNAERDSNNRPLRLIGVMMDVTDKKVAEEERKKLESQFRQSQKLEAVGQLAGGVAHDFNNILTAILGNVELGIDSAKKELGIDNSVCVAMEQIEQAAQRASALTRQLLTFSRRDVIQPRVLNLNQILKGLDSMLRRLISENIELKTVLESELKSIRADSGQIEQVIVNLVINAVHAMPDGGLLTLETRNVDLDNEYVVQHADAQTGPHVMLTISDSGHGMDAETLEHIFEPFFTTKNKDQGTGLGLSTVHGIIQQSGGHIMVYSEPWRGTTIKVYLPSVNAKAEDHSPSPAMSLPGGTETILLCEDDHSVRNLIAQSLRNVGYSVLIANNGNHGVQVANEHQGDIHLLITDVIMPDMNGKRLAENLQLTRPNLPILFISGYTSNIIAHHGVLDEGVEFLEKPFTQNGLLSRVREVIEKSRTVQS